MPRGQSEHRVGTQRFEEIRDGGLGWKFERDDKSASDIRVNLLLDIFRRRHSLALPAFRDAVNYVQAAISDFQGEGPRRPRDHGARDQ